MHGVAIELRGEIHGLEPELHNSSHSSAEGHRPHAGIAGGSPVGGVDGRRCEIPALLHVEVDEPFQEKLVHDGLVFIGMTGDRPVVVDKKPDRKMRGLHQRGHRRPDAEFPLPEIGRIGRDAK